MAEMERISPRPDYQYIPPVRILPREDFHPKSLHTRYDGQQRGVESIEAEWCPVCLGRKISERMLNMRPVWHCDDCGNEW